MESKVAWYKKLHIQILIALAAGIIVGWLGGPAAVPYYDWMGDLFMRLLTMVVVPLIASSMIVGVTGNRKPARPRTYRPANHHLLREHLVSRRRHLGW